MQLIAKHIDLLLNKAKKKSKLLYVSSFQY